MSAQATCDEIIDQIGQIMLRKEIRAALERLLEKSERSRIDHAIERMRRKLAYLAVIGSQGCGKSSLLNSLLFSVRTLPIGEGVTTNIVCFLQDSKSAEPRSEVVFRSGEPKVGPLSKEYLERYMDEAHNPGNKFEVTRITCFARSPLLTNNTVFVDTPGIGSLLRWQDETTLDFVRDISLGLCVIRTTPPLTKTDADFLNEIWQTCPKFFFVQNVWGEKAEEIAKSKRHNIEMLSGIARKNGDFRPVTIFDVDIHAGLEGATNDRPDQVNSSGLALLQGVIHDHVAAGGQRLEIEIQGRELVRSFEIGIAHGKNLVKETSVSDDDRTRPLREKIEEAEDKLADIRKVHRKRVASFPGQCLGVLSESKRRFEDATEEVRSDFARRAQAGEADISEEYESKLRRVANTNSDDFKSRFAGVCNTFIEGSAADIESIEESFEFSARKGDVNVGDLSGTHVAEAIGTFTAGGSKIALVALTGMSATAFGLSLAAGSTMTTALAAGAAAVPVVGWVVAGAALGVGVLMKVAAKEKRKATLLKAVNDAAKQMAESCSTALTKEVERIQRTVTEGVEEYFRSSVAQQEKFLEEMRATLNLSQEQKKASGIEISNMIEDLTTGLSEIDRLTRRGRSSAHA